MSTSAAEGKLARVASPSKRAPTRRRDAEENRQRILAAARKEFASSGFDAPMSAIAERAGVGRATLYRNFEDRFAIAAAIFEDNITDLERLANKFRDQPDALLTLLSAMVEQGVEAHVLIRAILTEQGAAKLGGLAERTQQVLRAPLRAAKAAGVVRDDLRLTDLIDILAMITGVVVDDVSPASRRRRARRALELLLEGLLPREPSA